jgi:hypothetical protein
VEFLSNVKGNAALKKSRHREEQIIGILNHPEATLKTADLIRGGGR